MTTWTVRLRYRGPDSAAAWASPEDRRDLAVWLADVLGAVGDGTYGPVGVVVHPQGFGVSFRVEAADSGEAILRACALVSEVVGDPDRVLGPVQEMATVPPAWRLTAALPRP